MQWSWSYLTFARGTRLIVEKEWRSFAKKKDAEPAPASAAAPPAPAPAEAAPPSKATESIRPPAPAPQVSEVPPPSRASKSPAPPVSKPIEVSRPPLPPVMEEPVTRTWQAPSIPPDVWEEPTTLFPSRD
jgi:hypothetical protein